MATLIKHGKIVTATEEFKGDVLIDGEKIISNVQKCSHGE